MPRSPDLSSFLAELESAKSRFERGHVARIDQLLDQLASAELNNPQYVIRFHECVLFLRAFPHSRAQINRVERLLDTFHRRIEGLQAKNTDMCLFDDFDTSGIAGTTMRDVLSFDVARWLERRIPKNVEIDWDACWEDYQAERNRGNTWPRFMPLLEEDADVEASIPWTAWIDTARGRKNALPWLLRCFAQLPLSAKQQAELYDSLRLPVCWTLQNLKLSRTRNWSRPHHFFLHDAPLIRRSEVSLERELARPEPKLTRLSAAAGKRVINAIREIMLVRYRELYGTTLGDARWVVRAELGRGVVMHFWGLPADRRLPLRAYFAGYTLKNGVPINYVEAIGLCEWLEIGFNTFYTYRQGETAWIYAQALRCLRALTGASCFSIYPYQIGKDNDEAIDSGAFWFYRKLGFRSGRRDLQALCKTEECKIAGNAKYRTAPRTLRRLAEAHMFYETTSKKGTQEKAGAWDSFSVRNIGLLVNRRMAYEFSGDSAKMRRASTAAMVRALKLNPSNSTSSQKQALENWSLVLALIPDLVRWTFHEKREIFEIILAKSGSNEMSYLRLTHKHARLRQALLRLGS